MLDDDRLMDDPFIRACAFGLAGGFVIGFAFIAVMAVVCGTLGCG